MSTGPVIRAAGVLPVRRRGGALQVALVHRPKYDDWSWPKGKLDRGEDFPVAAVRETLEETGLRVRLGTPLPSSRYAVRGVGKVVHYWTGTVVGGGGVLEHEVDDVLWLSPTLASRRLTYERDREQLAAAVQRHRSSALDTWSFLVVRHAHAVAREDWTGPDPDRPLSAAGRRRAAGRMSALLQAYLPEVVVTSPSCRCADSVRPFAERAGVPLVRKKGLSEEGFSAAPHKVRKHLRRIFEAAAPAAVCTHGPVLPTVIGSLVERAGPELDGHDRWMLTRLVDTPMDKGEVLACTMVGSGDDARVVAVQRHRPS